MLNNKFLLIVAAVVIGILVGGGFFFLSKQSEPQTSSAPVQQDESLPSLSPEDIGLTIEARPNKTGVKIIVAKTDDIKHIAYDVTYEADVPPNEVGGDGPSRYTPGFSDEVVITPGEMYESKFYDLGTCSNSRCRFDTGVEEVNLVMKVTKTDGKIYQVEYTFPL